MYLYSLWKRFIYDEIEGEKKSTGVHSTEKTNIYDLF